MSDILTVKREATFIHSESSSEYFHAEDTSCTPLADLLNKKRFFSLDLTYGYPIDVRTYEYLLDNGMTREEYQWFAQNQVKSRCVMGNDYYVTNEHMVHCDGTMSASGEILGYYVITSQYFRRYRLPVMHTETNMIEPGSENGWKNNGPMRIA